MLPKGATVPRAQLGGAPSERGEQRSESKLKCCQFTVFSFLFYFHFMFCLRKQIPYLRGVLACLKLFREKGKNKANFSKR